MNMLSRRQTLATGAGAALATALLPPDIAAAADKRCDREPHSAGPGKKWDLDGHAQRFRGNTFVFPVPRQSAFFRAEKAVMERLEASRLSDQFAVLPINSLHMTLFEGLTQNEVRDRTLPAWLADCEDVAETTRRILARLVASADQLPRLDPITMKVKDFNPLERGFSVSLEPADDASHDQLWSMRRALQDLLDIHWKDFDTYQFHSTMGYRLVTPCPRDERHMDRMHQAMKREFRGRAATVTLEPAAFNAFDDMLAFPQLWELPTR